MQLVAQKTDLLADVLTVELGVLVVLFGRRFKAGWRSHTQQIVIGLSTASIAQMAVRAIWQAIALHTVPHSQAEYEQPWACRRSSITETAPCSSPYLVWWIVCLWINEPGTESPAAAQPAVRHRRVCSTKWLSTAAQGKVGASTPSACAMSNPCNA